MEDAEPDLDDERAIELSSIAAIFPELIYSTSNPYSATLDVAVVPIRPLKVRFSEPLAESSLITPPTSVSIETSSSDQGKQGGEVATGSRDKNGRNDGVNANEHTIEHLPPLRLQVTLPEGYPSEKPPGVSLLVSPQWLSQEKLSELEAGCAKLWEELGRDQTVYTFIDNLQQGAESAFGLSQDGKAVSFSADLQLSLLDFNLKTKREKFDKESFDCGICLEPKKGKDCHRLLMCGHVFCVACLQDFYNNCITEGDIDQIKCMDPSCGKESGTSKKRKQHTLNPSELLSIPIEHEMVQRYVRLKRKKRLESDKDVIYCPRQWCQGPSRSKKHPKPINPLEDFVSDSESDAETKPSEPPPKKASTKKVDPNTIPMSERLSVCEDCDFAFCLVCKKSWHGEFGACNPRQKKELEEEEKASLAYLRHYSTPCPTCEAPAQKSHGCNHMICFKCNTHFCYLCSAWLSPDNPYQHFNTHGSNCYMRLWELEQGDGEGVVQRGFQDWGLLLHDEEVEVGADEGVAEVAQEDGAEVNGPDDAPDNPQLPPAAVQPINLPPQPPAPRERAIEFVNFAAQGGAQQGVGRRIVLPNQLPDNNVPEVVADDNAVCPVDQRLTKARCGLQDSSGSSLSFRLGTSRGSWLLDKSVMKRAPAELPVRQPQRQRQPHRQRNVRPAAPAAPPAVPVAGARGGAERRNPAALQRFLQLAQRDAEEEWDSDELEEFLSDGDDDSSGDEELHELARGRWGVGNVNGGAGPRVGRGGRGVRGRA
ncbi:E3 ubiquitin-protein ligase itt1 [Cyphellophora attinorum]|uniref:RBR-type E3 ubiquitin transferase n=1 Tax=Cyphellophora attinorum TaxID=1664694 RepID=A0A0N1H172_9EURO|nr:E3 ubiquitin-protein ligase itt1 [Phialophora attinorum]KPI37977.1 E3 ubiquitin-protein ligase itt1 [Phialophora attinorum]